MSTGHRRFYGKYYLLTILAPAYLSAAAHYGLAWLLLYLTGNQDPGLWWPLPLAILIYCLALLPLYGFYRIYTGIGFSLTGVPGSSRSPDEQEAPRLAAALALVHGDLDFSTGLQTYIVKTGGAPMLAISDGNPRKLWASRGMVTELDTPVLACMIAHELGHTAARPPAPYLVAVTATWLPAFFCTWALAGLPWLLIAVALCHTLLWLRVQLRSTQELERQADLTAIGLMGKDEYVSAYLACSHYVSGNSAEASIRRRLAGMGLPSAEIEARLTSASGPSDD